MHRFDHAADVAQRQLEADQHDDFVRRHDLHELRIALHAVDRQLAGRARSPRRASSPRRNRSVIRDTSRSSISVSGRRIGGVASLPPPSSRSMIGYRIDRLMSRINCPSSGGRVEQVEAGRVFEAEDELAVGELIDAGELHLDDRPQQGRQRRAEIAAEALVQRLQRPHLLLADALGPLEVVRRDLLAVPDRALVARVGDARPTSRPSIALSRLSTSAWLRTSSLIVHSIAVRSQASGSRLTDST